MKEASLTLDNGEIAYRCGGEGPLIVFSHALGRLAWEPLDDLMRSCTVAIPEWEHSTVPARTMGELGWFETLAKSLGFERATLGAWSMAGPAAIYFAAERPACLSHLILVDVAGMGPDLPPLQWKDIPHLVLTKIRGHATRGLVRAMWRNWVRQEHVDKEPLIEATYRFFRDQANALEDPTAGEDDEDEDDDSLLDELPGIEVPTLVLSGRYSTVLGPRHGRVATALLPNGEHVIFDESSHSLQLEEPQKFQKVVAAFVTGGAGGPAGGE